MREQARKQETQTVGEERRMGEPSGERKRAPGRWRGNQRALTPFLFLLPFFLIYSMFMLYPVVDALRLSFFDAGGFGTPEFIGLDNYRQLLQDPRFI